MCRKYQTNKNDTGKDNVPATFQLQHPLRAKTTTISTQLSFQKRGAFPWSMTCSAKSISTQFCIHGERSFVPLCCLMQDPNPGDRSCGRRVLWAWNPFTALDLSHRKGHYFPHCSRMVTGADAGFWSVGPSRVLTGGGWAQNVLKRGFSLQIVWQLNDF